MENQKDGKLKESNPGEIEDGIFKYMTQVLPDTVITFDQTGISNHPDHVRMCFSTTYSFQEYVSWLESVYEKKGIQGRYEEPWLKKVEKMVQAHVEPNCIMPVCRRVLPHTPKKRRLFLPNHLVNRGTVRRTKNYDCYRYSPICREKT